LDYFNENNSEKSAKLIWIYFNVFTCTAGCRFEIVGTKTGNRLNEYVLHYETLDYDADAVAAQHSRHKRNAGGEKEELYLQLHFRSHGKPFRLKLKRDTSSFSPDVQFVSHKGHPLNVDTSHLYEGHLQGEH
jgi:disintegrin and metalloproteinase domain-containing protein 10